MSTPIPAVDTEQNIASALFIDLQLGSSNYYISDAYKPFTINSNEYTALGAFLSVEAFQTDFKTTQSSISFGISGIPNTTDYMRIINTEKIKGGSVTIRRKFFDADTLLPLANAEYIRYNGIISNFHVEENTDFIAGIATNTIVFEIASVYTILSKRIAGQRTNGSDRRRFYPDDISFDNVSNIRVLPEFDRA